MSLRRGVIAAAKELSLRISGRALTGHKNAQKGKELLADGLKHRLLRMIWAMRLAKLSLPSREEIKMAIWIDKDESYLPRHNGQPRFISQHWLPRIRKAICILQIVGGVTPGKGGTTHEGFAVYAAQLLKRNIKPSAMYRWSLFSVAADAICEAVDAELDLVEHYRRHSCFRYASRENICKAKNASHWTWPPDYYSWSMQNRNYARSHS